MNQLPDDHLVTTAPAAGTARSCSIMLWQTSCSYPSADIDTNGNIRTDLGDLAT